ncbi:hypothetical protein AVEN_68583-1 [Araneus ventricosus]|uniref:Uncharacterized protein n=1 Tax=Araneus ventricosus TaxID=182803 RepID=A0A4Y2FH60_ARAVE|nr:hypothetical protein AVEN_68583-1 [Araneus ventricosus]
MYGACCTLSGQTSSRWCGVKIPTLARPTQGGCNAARGPAGREPLRGSLERGVPAQTQVITNPFGGHLKSGDEKPLDKYAGYRFSGGYYNDGIALLGPSPIMGLVMGGCLLCRW